MKRHKAWQLAMDIVDEIVEEHPLEAQRTSPNLGSSYTTSAAEQRVELITEVADWLLQKDDD